MKINCPVANCIYSTEDVEPSVAAALLQLHNNSHANARTLSINNISQGEGQNIKTTVNSTVTTSTPEPRVSNCSYTPRTYEFWKSRISEKAGPRAVPSRKRKSQKQEKYTRGVYPNEAAGKCTEHTYLLFCHSVLKAFLVSEISVDGTLETIIEIRIDLQKIENVNANFNVNDIQKEIGYQLESTEDMVILYKNGSPVKDSPNTRGVSAWNNKMAYRAVNMLAFQHAKPSSWEFVKRDYGIYGDLLDNLLPDISEFNEDILFGEKTDERNQKETSCASFVNNSEITEIKVAISRLENSVNRSSNNAKKTKQSLVELFKCLVCLETQPLPFLACPFCGRYLGCFSCIKNLPTCPICRKRFRCADCQTALPMAPVFIPGLRDLLDLPEVQRVHQLQSSTSAVRPPLPTENDSSSDEDDSLPPVLPQVSSST